MQWVQVAALYTATRAMPSREDGSSRHFAFMLRAIRSGISNDIGGQKWHCRIINSSGFVVFMQRSSQGQRNQWVELLRIVAAFGIIAFHAHAPGAPAFYSGLVFFVMLSPLMEMLHNRNRRREITSLGKSLLVPWAFWMLIYGAANAVRGNPVLPSAPLPFALLRGTSIHLWFLPFLFVVMVLLNIAKYRGNWPALFWLSAVSSAILLGTSGLWRPIVTDDIAPLPQWFHAAPAVFAGIAFGLSPQIGRAAWVGGLLVAGGLAIAIGQSVEGIALPYSIALPLTAMAVFIGRHIPHRFSVQPIADCMLGVFLVHVLALNVASHLVGRNNLGTASVAFIIALASTWAARKWVPQSRLVLG